MRNATQNSRESEYCVEDRPCQPKLIHDVTSRTLRGGIEIEFDDGRFFGGAACNLDLEIASLAIGWRLGGQHHHQAAAGLDPTSFLNRNAFRSGEQLRPVCHVEQGGVPIRGKSHEFEAIGIGCSHVPDDEHGEIGAPGINPERFGDMSFDGLSANENVDVAGPMRLATPEQVPKVGRQRRFAGRIFCYRGGTGSLPPEEFVQHPEWITRPRLRLGLLRGIHSGEQLFGRDSIKVAKWSRTRTRSFGAQHSRFAGFDGGHEEPSEGAPGHESSQRGRFQAHRCRLRSLQACVVNSDLNQDFVGGQIVKRNVFWIDAEIGCRTEVNLWHVLDNSHTITFRLEMVAGFFIIILHQNYAGHNYFSGELFDHVQIAAVASRELAKAEFMVEADGGMIFGMNAE